MRPIEDIRDRGNSPLVVALTGDGRREKKILQALAQRYDGFDRALLLPTKAPPIGAERRRNGRFIGLSAFQVVKTYSSKFKFSCYLMIIDIEHLGGNRTPGLLENQIRRSLNSFGFRGPEITTLNDRAYRITSLLGSRRIYMNAVLSGSDKCVEEDIAELLRLEHGLTVAPNKAAIRDELSRLGTDLQHLLINCQACNLSRAFPGLIAALQDLEDLTFQ